MDAPTPDVNRAPDLGRIIGITGSGAIARLFKTEAGQEDSRVTIGRLVGISAETSLIVGVVVRMSVSPHGASRFIDTRVASDVSRSICATSAPGTIFTWM